jgi:Concanavalin A-like lectin/glucanases superfamily
MVRISRRQGFRLMLGASQAALLGAVVSHPLYANTVTALNPVAYWHLGEVGGTTIVDEKAVQNGTYVGSIEYGVEPILSDSTGTSIGFNGVNAYGQIAHNAAFAVANGTIVFAVQADSVAGQQMLLAKDGGAPVGGLTVDINNGRLRAYIRDGTRVAVWLPSPGGAADIRPQTAHHIALTWGSRGAELWLDGVLIASNPGLTVGLGSNTAALFIAAYAGPTAFGDVVMDEVAWFDRQLTPPQIRSLAKPRSFAHGAGVGVQIPHFDYQTITDSIPAGAIWWDPTNGNDSQDGSIKANAKLTFSAAQSAVSSGGTIVIAGGTHVVGTLTTTKANVTLLAEPHQLVVLYRVGDFRGALDRTWTWTLIDSTRKIWESPALGIADAATTVTKSGDVGKPGNALDGFIVIPDGGVGKHFMRCPWVDGQAILNQGTSGQMGNGGSDYPGTHYAGPCLYLPGNGRVRLRMQKPFPSYTGTDWPNDGRMGTLIAANGAWAEPASENPNDYEIHIVRWSSFGASTVLFQINHSGWTIKGVNVALTGLIANIKNAKNVTFEKCTLYPVEQSFTHSQNTTGFKLTRCRIATGDVRHISWSTFKVDGGYYFQHHRNALLSQGGAVGSTTLADALVEHCTIFGMFDVILPNVQSVGPIVVDHCAVLRTVDDGGQVASTGPEMRIQYTYWNGGPMGGWEGKSSSSNPVHQHHNVYDGRIPMLWDPGNACPHTRMPEHGVGSNGPVRPFRTYYNTYILSPDSRDRRGLGIVPQDGRNLPGGAHAVFNNIFVILDNRRYPTKNAGAADYVTRHYSTENSAAGTQQFDYNAYHRDIPRPIETAFFREFQTSQGADREDFATLTAWRASAKYAQSAGMYTDGTAGHEHHGVQENPQFRDLSARDYRPQSSGTISGAKHLTATGWPGTGTFQDWKGALDPNGNGSEVGPQNP